MLEKLAKQTAVYGISTIVVRFLSYLLTPYYTRIFGQETYGIVTDIYALIPLALTLLTMGMESSYFRFSAKAEEAGGDVRAAKRRLFATTWGVTSLAAVVFFVLVASFRNGVAGLMGEAYAAHPEYVVWVGLIILFDVWACIPFSRLREQGRALLFVGIKALNVVMNVALAVAFGVAGLFATEFGVGWVFVANLIASVVTWLVILATVDRVVFALIVGRDFREGIFILPVVLGANVLTGVWLNLSFWYKREEKTSLAIVVTGAGLVSMLVFGFWCIPVWGYYGAAWARLASESTMVAVSWWLNRRFYPTPYDWRRIGEYVAAALAVFAVCEAVTACGGNKLIAYAFNIVLFAAYALYLVRRERIDVAALVKAALKRK